MSGSEPTSEGTEGVRNEAASDAAAVSRRAFLGGAASAGAAGILSASIASSASAQGNGNGNGHGGGGGGGGSSGMRRREAAYRVRLEASQLNRARPMIDHVSNGDEDRYADKIGNYSKGLPHNRFGEVDVAAYAVLQDAAQREDADRFEDVPSGNSDPATRIKLTNPQAGMAFELEGSDSHQLGQPPAPAFASAWAAGEVVENYWMAHLRDVPFEEYGTNPLAIAAAAELSSLSDFRGPKEGGLVTARTMFRDGAPGTSVGPWISQFFWLAQPFGAQFIEPRIRTTAPGLDYLTTPAAWLSAQNGVRPSTPGTFDPTLRYIRNGRDLAQWVHIDVLFQAYFQALLTLMQGPASDPRFSGLAAPLNPGNPYNASQIQAGFGTFGGPYFATILCEIATRALKAVWFQKWFVHRRIRPEEFAGRVHHKLASGRPYPLHADVLDSQAVAEAFSRNGTYLLPLAFPEGCPTHPAYGAGHATVAGACVTILKALFDERKPIVELTQPQVATSDGLALVPYVGSDVSQMTVGSELNKLASNVAFGRNIAGVHWRTDGSESMRLGEEVAICVLRDQRLTFTERFEGFTFTKFDGTTVTV